MKIKLNVEEIIQLNQELLGLIQEKELTFTLKWYLVKLSEKTQPVVKRFNDQKLELFKKYGIERKDRPGTYTLDGSKDIEKGKAELDKLIEIEEEFTAEFKFKDFEDLKSTNPYIKVMRFIKK